MVLEKYIDYPDAWSYQSAWDWRDISAYLRVTWDDSYLYLFVQIQDDARWTDDDSWWLNDGIEIYLDGDNSKGDSYDSNDFQIGYVRGQDYLYRAQGQGASFRHVVATKETPMGWNFECKILNGDIQIQPVYGRSFGFEIQINDNDNNYRDNLLKWWDENNLSYLRPSTFGTMRLFYEQPNVNASRHIFGSVMNTDRQYIQNATVEVMDGVSGQPVGSGATDYYGVYKINVAVNTGVEGDGAAVVRDYQLLQNYPNPFNPFTTIEYSADRQETVRLEVFNVSGRKVKDVYRGFLSPGHHRFVWNGTDNGGRPLSAGLYFYRIRTPEKSITRKMIMVDGSSGQISPNMTGLENYEVVRSLEKPSGNGYRIRVSKEFYPAIYSTEKSFTKIMADTMVNFDVIIK